MDDPRIPLPDPPLAADGIRLRAFTLDDVADVVLACQDPQTARWTAVPQPYGDRDAREWIGTHAEARAEGRECSFAAADVRTGRVLASIGFVRLDWDQRLAEIGYWAAPWARGRGVTTTATRLLARWALDRLGVERVELLAATDNHASQRVAEKAGFTREGVLRQARLAPRSRTERQDLVLYSLLASDVRG